MKFDSMELPADVRTAVERSFSQAQRPEAVEALASSFRDFDRWPVFLILANRSLRELRRLLEMEENDPRDIACLIQALSDLELESRRKELGLASPRSRREQHESRLQQAVPRFVGEAFIYPAERITEETCLQTDLGAAGVEGDRFMRNFAERFEVDLGQYRSELYFERERATNLRQWVSTLWKKRPTIVPIRVGDLLAAARSRKWVGGGEPPTTTR